MLAKIWCLVVVIVATHRHTYADLFEECEGKAQTYMEVKDDCSYYIFCHGEDSFADACPDESPYFSIAEQTCDINKDVCQDRPILKEPTTIEEEEVATSSASSTTASPTTGLTTALSTAAAAANSSSAATDFADVTPTTSSSWYSFTEIQLVTTVNPLPTVCPPVDNPYKAIFLPHKKSCSEYFLCYRGERLPMRCSKMLHFDVRQQKCDHPENVKCHIMDFASPREQCLPQTFDVYPHPRNCNYYYQCMLGYLRVMQCPLNMAWHYEKRACVRRSQAKCYNTFARANSK